MSVSNGNKVVSKDTLKCGENTQLTISFDSASELIARPADIVIILDKSSSMSGERIANAEKGVKDVINMVSLASGSTTGDEILNNSKIGLVSFATSAKKESDLTQDTNKLYDLVDKITTGGSTNHYGAFEMAGQMLDTQTTNDKIILLFTDGITTIGANPDQLVEDLKQKGIEIYCVGLVNDRTNLEKWASSPIDTHVVSTTNVDEIEELFKKVSYEIVLAGAKEVKIVEKLNPNFKYNNIINMSHGNLIRIDDQTVIWTIDAVGLTPNDRMELVIDISYIGNINGTINVNNSILYTDRDNNKLSFPNPEVNVSCGTVIDPDKPVVTDVLIEGCTDYKSVEVTEIGLSDIGRILSINVPLKNVCPNKQIGLGIVLSEVDSSGNQLYRGLKTVLLDSIPGDQCQDILVKCIKFVLPEKIDATGNIDAMCNDRNFKVQVFANYIDTDYQECNLTATII